MSTNAWYFATQVIAQPINCDTPPNPLIDSTISPKVKITKGKGVWVHSLVCNISWVEKHAEASRWELKRMTSGSIIHTNLHKPNNKLVSA